MNDDGDTYSRRPFGLNGCYDVSIQSVYDFYDVLSCKVVQVLLDCTAFRFAPRHRRA
jgi:hypothetical protein